MPSTNPRRKRRADDLSDDGDEAAAKTPKSKRMTKEEKAAARERARQSMTGVGGTSSPPAAAAATPAKRRKINAAPKAATEKKPSRSTTTPRAAAAPAPAASTSKKLSRKEAQRQARERAANWAQEEQKKNQSSPVAAAPAATTTAPSPAPPEVEMGVEEAKEVTSGSTRSRRESSGSSATATSRRYRPGRSSIVDPDITSLPTTSRARPGRAGVARQEEATIPNPPSSIPNPPPSFTTPAPARGTFPVLTASGERTNEMNKVRSTAFSYTPVLQQPPAAATSPMGVPPAAPIPPKMDTGVRMPVMMQQQPKPFVPAQASQTVDASNDSTEENDYGDDSTWMIQDFIGSKFFRFFLLPLALAGLALHARGAFVYNPKSGMFMVVGTAQIPYERKDKTFTVLTDSPIDLATLAGSKVCFQDSPDDVLEWMEEDALDAVVEPTNCLSSKIPCPPNGICYRGEFLDCQGPVWQKYEEEVSGEGGEEEESAAISQAKPHCILSQSANKTYEETVGLLESWSIREMCFHHLDGITPRSYYLQIDTDPTKLVEASNKRGIPLYTWSTIYKEGPESLASWDWEQLQLVNQAHQKLTIDDSSDSNAISVGLSKAHFALVESKKLPSSCATMRRMIFVCELIGEVIVAMSWGILKNAWIVVAWLAQLLWFCLLEYPLVTVPTLIVTIAVVWYRHRQARRQRQRKEVEEIRKKALKRLQHCLHMEPGPGMKKGEVAVMHLRDYLVDANYSGRGDRVRNVFLYELWPQVCTKIKRDNRVYKTSRSVNGVKRELLMWVASVEEES